MPQEPQEQGVWVVLAISGERQNLVELVLQGLQVKVLVSDYQEISFLFLQFCCEVSLFQVRKWNPMYQTSQGYCNFKGV